jgi:hypothetical protein
MKPLIKRALYLLFWLAVASGAQAQFSTPTHFGSSFGFSAAPVVAIANGQALSLVIPSANFADFTDLSPASQFVEGWTGTLTLKGMNVGNATADYNCLSSSVPVGCQLFSKPLLTMTVTKPGFTSGGATTTVSQTIHATAWLRNPFSNASTSGSGLYNTPFEDTSGSNAGYDFAFDDWVYADDTVNSATLTGSGAGTGSTNALIQTAGGAATASVATSGITVTNSSTKVYPHPICQWITEPGLRFDGRPTSRSRFSAAMPMARTPSRSPPSPSR